MRRAIILTGILALLGFGIFWIATQPRHLAPDALTGLSPNPANGERVFWAAGCASCHMAPGATGADQLRLAGGQTFPSPFGTFTAPNISNDPAAGIGAWTALDLANAMKYGVSKDGRHLYPVFPYASYTHATLQDIVDLRAFLATLPAVAEPAPASDIPFPFNIRRGVGLWKLLYLREGWMVGGDLTSAELRGRYLAEALTHCGECHTPRTALGGMDRSRWLGGAPNPSGKGTVPNITPGKLHWSEAEITEYLTSGFTPEYDSAGGLMAEVIANLGHLPASDRAAIAAYLGKVPPVE